MNVAGLGDLQGQVLCVLADFPAGATIGEILSTYAEVTNPPAHTTVLSVLVKLMERGLVTREVSVKVPRAHDYKLAVPIETILTACVQNMVQNLFGGDKERLRKLLES